MGRRGEWGGSGVRWWGRRGCAAGARFFFATAESVGDVRRPGGRIRARVAVCSAAHGLGWVWVGLGMGLEEVRGMGGSEIRRSPILDSSGLGSSERASYEAKQLRERVGSGQVAGGEYDEPIEAGARDCIERERVWESRRGHRTRCVGLGFLWPNSTPIRVACSAGARHALNGRAPLEASHA